MGGGAGACLNCIFAYYSKYMYKLSKIKGFVCVLFKSSCIFAGVTILMTEMPGNQSPSVANDNSRESSGISGDSARVNGSGIRAVSAKAPFFSSSAPVDPRS